MTGPRLVPWPAPMRRTGVVRIPTCSICSLSRPRLRRTHGSRPRRHREFQRVLPGNDPGFSRAGKYAWGMFDRRLPLRPSGLGEARHVRDGI